MVPMLKRRRTDSGYVDTTMALYPAVTGNMGRLNRRQPRFYRSRGNYNSSFRASPYGQLSQNVTHVNPRLPPPEIKTFDIAANGAIPVATPASISIPNTGAVILLNGMNSGSTSSTRVGLSCVIKNCSYRFEVDLPVDPADQVPTSGRVMLIWDRQPNQTLATYTDIFTVANYLSFAVNIGFSRFVVLRNQQFSLSPNGNQSLFFEGFAKINMKTTYGTATAPSVPASGALYAVVISDQALADNQPLLSGCWRVRYVDV